MHDALQLAGVYAGHRVPSAFMVPTCCSTHSCTMDAVAAVLRHQLHTSSFGVQQVIFALCLTWVQQHDSMTPKHSEPHVRIDDR